MQPDIAQFRHLTRRNDIPLDSVVHYMNRRFSPSKIREVPYIITIPIADFGKPFLLIPANPNRMFFVISNQSARSKMSAQIIKMHFGFPSNPTLGIQIAPSVQPRTGTISVDDIYITATSGMLPAPATVVGYEGTLALEKAS